MYHHAVLHERHVQISWNLASSMEVTRDVFYNFMCISLILFPIQHYIQTGVMVRFRKCRSAHIADVIHCGMAIRHNIIFIFYSLVVNWTVHLGLALLWPYSLWLRLSLSVMDTSSAESGEKNSRIYLYKYHWCFSDNPVGGLGAGRVAGGSLEAMYGSSHQFHLASWSRTRHLVYPRRTWNRQNIFLAYIIINKILKTTLFFHSW